MPRRVSARDMTLRELFAVGFAYGLPPLQRSYAWTDKENRFLAEDTIGAATESETIDPDDLYYMGAVVVVKGDDDVEAAIIDGQQRLTSITIMLAVLRDLETDQARKNEIQGLIGNHPYWRITLRAMDAEFFRETVQQTGATIDASLSVEADNDSRAKIRNAVKFMQKELSACTPGVRRQVASYLMDNVLFVVMTAQDADSAYRLFRTQNERGLSLQPADIIKSEVLERCGYDREQAEEAAIKWDMMEADLTRPTFGSLLSSIRKIYGRRLKGERTILLDYRASVWPVVQPRVFLDQRLPAFVEIWKELAECRISIPSIGEEISRTANYLDWLPHGEWRPVAMHILDTHRNDPQLALRCFTNLESLAYAMELGLMSIERRNKRYQDIMCAVDDPATVLKSGSPLLLSSEERNIALVKLGQPMTQKDVRRAICFRLNAALPEGQLPSTSGRKATVEHVLPVGAGPRWSGRNWSEKDRRELANILGNFAILYDRDNNAAGSLDYDLKRPIYFKADNRGLADFALTQDLYNVEAWTPDAIKRRQVRMVGILAQVWQLI
jgi:hypothetical protein